MWQNPSARIWNFRLFSRFEDASQPWSQHKMRFWECWKGAYHSESAGRKLTIEESIEVLITVKVKPRIFTAGAVCLRRKTHLERERQSRKWMDLLKSMWPSVPKSFMIHLRRTKGLHDSNYICSTPNPASTPTPALQRVTKGNTASWWAPPDSSGTITSGVHLRSKYEHSSRSTNSICNKVEGSAIACFILLHKQAKYDGTHLQSQHLRRGKMISKFKDSFSYTALPGQTELQWDPVSKHKPKHKI